MVIAARSTTIVSIASIATAALALASLPAVAADSSHQDAVEANFVADLVASVNIGDEPIITPSRTGSTLIAESVGGEVDVALPVEPGSIDLTKGGDSRPIGIEIPPEAVVQSAVVAADGTIVYLSEHRGDGVDVAVHVVEDGSIRIQTVIDSPESPHEYTYALDVPDGTVLSLEEDGSVLGLDAAGNFVVGASAPWAKNSEGGKVQTSYRIEGSSIIQSISEVDPQLYPLVADPWLGIDLIDRVVWASNLWKYSPTMKVYPTWYGRFGPVGARWAAWSETLAKTPRSGWPNPDTASLRDQFYCHYDIVRLRAPNKEYWGLDSKLPNRGYWGFVGNECN